MGIPMAAPAEGCLRYLDMTLMSGPPHVCEDMKQERKKERYPLFSIHLKLAKMRNCQKLP